MAGIKDLNRLLKEMKPELVNKKFVFSTISEAKFSGLRLKPLLIFREKEGITLILEKEVADNNALHYSGIWMMVTLAVHSDISAVGFLARITDKLAEAGISVNVISAYHHDHLFVPAGKAKETIKILNELSKQLKPRRYLN